MPTTAAVAGVFSFSDSLAGCSLGSKSAASQSFQRVTACRVLPPDAGELPRLAPRLDRFSGAGFYDLPFFNATNLLRENLWRKNNGAYAKKQNFRGHSFAGSRIEGLRRSVAITSGSASALISPRIESSFVARKCFCTPCCELKNSIETKVSDMPGQFVRDRR